jgi:hypothetical protein
MNVESAILILKDYVNVDRQMRQHRTESDFEQFCETTCIAIDTVISEVEKYIGN